MTRKHYKAIAEIINKNRKSNNAGTWRMITRLADYFTADNDRFNRNKFIKACIS